MSEPTNSPVPELTECTQANVLAEAAANMAAAAAARAAEAKAKAAEALARAAAIKAAAGSIPAEQAAQAAEAAATARAEASALAAKSPAVVPAAAIAVPKAVAAQPAASAAESEAQAADKPAPAPSAAAAAPAPEQVLAAEVAPASPATTDDTAVDRRDTKDRRKSPVDMRHGLGAPAPERRQEQRRDRDALRATDLTDNSGIIRLGNAVRAQASATAADRRAIKHARAAAKPGEALEPIARTAGLHNAKVHLKRKTVSPGLIFLLALMAFFGLYATGNLPQFDQWTDAAVHKTQAHNADVVNAVVNDWRMFAWAGVGVCVLLILFLIWNARRARAGEAEE